MSDYYGTAGDDVIDESALGFSDHTTIYGGAGNDTVTLALGAVLGQLGNDTLVGTTPWSTALYWDSPAPVSVNFATGKVLDGWGTTDTLINLWTVHLGYGDNHVTGSDHAESVWPTSTGSNDIDLGGGTDTVTYYNARSSDATVTYDAAQHAFTVVKHFAGGITGTDVLRNVEAIEFRDANNNSEIIDPYLFTGPFGPSSTAAIPSGNGIQQLLEGDFNGDGRTDIWVARIEDSTIGEIASPPQILLGDGAGGFTDGTASVFAGAVPMLHYGPRIAGADFNADGITDVFVPDFGADKPPFTGGQNRLFVSAGGKLTDQSGQLLQRLTQGHGVSVGDIDGNGFPDVLVNGLNDPSGRANEVIFSDGTGGFTTSTALFPSVVQSPGTWAGGNTWSYVGDLNADGMTDLVLATWENTGGPSRVLLASAPGVFPASGVRALPETGVAQPTIVAVSPIDLNGDGLRDLVLSATNGGDHAQFYQVPYLQFLVNQGDGNFSDETVLRFPQDPADRTGYWYKFVEIVDVNGDGADDILAVTNRQNIDSADLLLNDGSGHFSIARTFVGHSIVHAMDVDGDAIPELVAATGGALTIFENDIFDGRNGNLVFHAGERPEHITGGDGIDTVIYAGASSSYGLAHAANGWTVTRSGVDVDSLAGVERLAFSDHKVALDMDGHAGIVARYLGAVFGADAVHNEAYAGIGLSYIDSGTSEADLMQLALQARFGAGATNADVVAAIYQNVVGVAPDSTDLAYFTGLLDNGTYSRVGLAQMAAMHDANAAHIGLATLVGVTGLAYA